MVNIIFQSSIDNQIIFLNLIFPVTLAILYLLFGWLFSQFKRKLEVTNRIVYGFVIISVFLLSVGFAHYVDWVYSIQVGCLILLSLSEIERFSSNYINHQISVSIKIVIYGLTLLILLGQFANNFFSLNFLMDDGLGLPAFWAGILLFITCGFKIYSYLKILGKEKLSLTDFYDVISVFSLLPLGFWLIGNINLAINPLLLIPFLFGLFWIGVLLVYLIQKDRKDLHVNESFGFSLIVGWTSIIGLGLLIFSLLDKNINQNNISLLRSICIYMILFSLGISLSLDLFKSKKQRNKPNLETAGQAVTKEAFTIEELIVDLKNSIFAQTSPRKFILYLLESNENLYKPYKFSNQAVPDIYFPETSRLVKWLKENPKTTFLDLSQPLSGGLVNESNKFKLIEADLLIPVRAEDQLLGWIFLSNSELDKDKNEKIGNKLFPLMDEFGYLYKRMDDQMRFEQREKNINILSRIVKGVNYTLELDDIYELMYAQTSQIIPSDIFYIVLGDEKTQDFRFVFYVNQNEREYEREGSQFSNSNSLEMKVVQSGQGLFANGFGSTSQSINIKPHLSDVINTALVPLNTADKTIGCVFLGRYLSEDVFSNEQFELLQSIADLVAGAIEKARLLDETEQHVKQLSRLNEVIRNLSSIKNIDHLLKSILKFSNNLIEFEETRLIRVDQATGDLHYQKEKGEKPNSLVLSRLKNNIKWFDNLQNGSDIVFYDSSSSSDEELISYYEGQNITIYSLMLLPLVIKDKIVGFLELINRKDRNYFSENEKQLMKSYASQAAITWENAQLYQQTDQELAERVEELSTMQKIDRELNASLDSRTTLSITLEWAMKWLRADAGWIGLLNENEIIDIQYSGYDEILKNKFPSELSLDRIQSLVNTEWFEPISIKQDEFLKFHPSTKAQIISPVYREDNLVAILFLELFNEFQMNKNQKLFLARLGDHASIAIKNSQYYEEIQKANLAKSEFVSLVAHELKNPMTSIKGYTELLTSGAAGDVSEAQLNFLAIIRNNTDRMNALVSDLNDLTKIETGNIHLEVKPVQIKRLFDELERSLIKQINQKNQTLLINGQENLPDVLADENRLLQVLINLVSNANKYSKETGKIYLKAEKAISIGEVKYNQPKLHVEVQDTGVGISDEDQKSIFQKFFRSEDPNVRSVSGTGLGLNITRSLVELMGGMIWFESEIGKGTTFHLVMPFAENENP